MSVLASAGVAAAAACFPDYGIAAGDGGPGSSDATTDGAHGDGSSSSDGTIGADASGDVSPAGDGGGDGAGDGGTHGDANGSGDSATTGDSGDAGPGPDSGPTGDSGIVTIGGGTFYFQVLNTDAGFVDAQATLDYAVAIDQNEVTVGRFQAWLDAGMPVPSPGASLDAKYSTMQWDSTWSTPAKDTNYNNASLCNQPGGKGPTYGKGNASFPMNCVTWEQALAFCAWDHGRRLPTDTEWRVVATSEGRRQPYPWGTQTTIDCTYATYNDGNECQFPVHVGSAPQGTTLDGVVDIVGSLSEWLWDYGANGYAYPANAGTDYAGPAASVPNHRLWIGGDYSQNGNGLKTTQPGPIDSSPEQNFDNTGFRCAQSK